MTILAQVLRCLRVEPHKAQRIGAVGIMATTAVKGLVRLRRILQSHLSPPFFHCFAERMSGRRRTGVYMRLLHYISMAFETDRNGFLHQQRHLIRRVRVMAVRAAHTEGGMNTLFGKHRLVVAGVADFGLVGDEKLWPVR